VVSEGRHKKKRVMGGWGDAGCVSARAGKLLRGSALLESLLGRVGMGCGWKEDVGDLGVVRRGLVGRRGYCRAKRERGWLVGRAGR